MVNITSTKFNYFYSMAYSVLTMLLPLITTPYISRIIGAEGLGIYSYNYSLTNYFMLFAMLGINYYGNRCVAKNRDNQKELNQVFSEIYSMQLLISMVTIISYILYALFIVNENRTIVWIQLLMIISPSVTLSWFFMGLEQFKITVTRNFIIKILSFCFIFIFVKTATDLWKYTLIMSIGILASEGILIFIIPKYVSFHFVKMERIFPHIKSNISLFLPIMAVSVYRTMDKIMLAKLVNYTQVGYYSNAEKIINICLASVTALGQVMLPKMINILAKGEIKRFKDSLYKSLEFVTIITSAMTFGILSVSKEFVPFFFGKEYSPCIPILSLLATNLIFLSWGNVLKTQYLIPKEYDKIYIKAVFGGAAINLMINFLLIVRLEAIGAVIGTLCAELFSLIYIMYKIKDDISIKRAFVVALPYVIFGLIMLVCVTGVRMFGLTGILGLGIEIMVGVVVYIVLILVYWYIKNDEYFKYFQSILKIVHIKIRGPKGH